ncbi:MAG: N-acetylmuramic acid 6-phosphate phosphatase [Paracidovorax wautersii]|uniref:phosphoglycolate phosphatase n=1 Tax=Paracidovorax wautersii TaxID=1177982 RepID=A0A7V8FM22_9BURK|nr:MAG: N-acetylmuramic acid 6-phosphate phosphatase [Paracidovorax wautersii]
MSATLSTDSRAVLFDLDGTLIDSAPDLGGAANDMRAARGLHELPLEDYRPLAGSGARGMLSVAFGLAPGHADFDALREEFFSRYEIRMTQNTHVFDGIADLLGALQARGLRWGIVTNKMERFTLPLVRSIPLFASAAAVVCGDTTPHAKPHPEPLFEAARRLGLPPEHCIYVGDDHRDIVAGRAAGMPTVAANYGYLGAVDPLEWRADWTIKSPLDLLQCLSSS